MIDSSSMKKISFILTILFVAIFLTPTLFAAPIASEGTRTRKLQRGFLNIVLSPIEISNEMAKEEDKEEFIPTWLTGMGRGACYAVGRALAGVYDLVTFAVSAPAHYDPLVYPEFPWDHLEEKK